MAATTDQKKARLLDLLINVGELVRDGNRDIDQVSDVLQVIKDGQGGAEQLLAAFQQRAIPKPAPKPVEPEPLLEALGTVKIYSTSEQFIARNKFVLNYGRKAKPGVRIAYLDDNFKVWYLDKVEEPMPETVLRYAKLTRPARDDDIRAEIGAEFEQTALAQIFGLMSDQPNGEPGILLTDLWNVFYVPDIHGSLRAVSVRWGASAGGWSVSAGSVGHPGGWRDGHRVFSRNSSFSETVAV